MIRVLRERIGASQGKTDIMENQNVINCFDCPEFNNLKGSCKRANKKLPCIKQEPITDAQPKQP